MSSKPTFAKTKFLTFDIESQGFDKFLLGGVYDGKNFSHTDQTRSFENLMEYIFTTNNNITIAYAHFGGIFDFIHVLNFLFSKNSQIQVDNIILQGSKILKMDVSYHNRTIQFIDSSGLFPFSLEKLSKSFGVTHEKIKFDVTNLSEITPDLIKYLKNDCVGLYECLEIYFQKEYIKDIPHQTTRSGVSFKVFTNFFVSEKQLPKFKDSINTYCRRSYFGGRTEIFKPLYQSNKNPLYHYDINSLYPSVMRENDFIGNIKGIVSSFKENELGIYKLEVECPKNIHIPLLGINHNGKYIFPTGKFSGYFCSPEINKAISLGYKIKVKSGYIFENKGKMFAPFVDHFYNLRKNTQDSVEKIIYKDILNHLYGRLGINQNREQISFYPEAGTKILSEIKMGDYVIRLYSKEKIIRCYSAPAISSFVTSYARLKLYSYFELAGMHSIYYTDTDSLFTTTKLHSSGEIGEMKLEAELNSACFLLPKTYSTIDMNNIQSIKLKGIPHKSIGHIDFKTFIDSVAGDIRLPEFKVNKGLARVKTGFKKGNLLHVLNTEHKNIKAVYDKRIITGNPDNYSTKPIELH